MLHLIRALTSSWLLHQAMCTLSRLIPLACTCLFNAKLGFCGSIIKSDLIYYLCILPLHYSDDIFMHYCIFVWQYKLTSLPLLNSVTPSHPWMHELLICSPPHNHPKLNCTKLGSVKCCICIFCLKQQANAFLMFERCVWRINSFATCGCIDWCLA